MDCLTLGRCSVNVVSASYYEKSLAQSSLLFEYVPLTGEMEKIDSSSFSLICSLLGLF